VASQPLPSPIEEESGQPLLRLAVAPAWGGRNVGYADRVTPTLSGYRGSMPLVGLTAELYPGAWSGLVVLKDLGVTGRFSRSLGGSTATADGAATLTTQWTRYGAGLRYRLVVGGREWGGVALGWGGGSFRFGGPSLQPALLPDGTTSEWRAGLDGALPLGPVTVRLGAGGLLPHGGALGAAFPAASEGGVDGRLGASVQLGGHVELGAGVEYVRYFWSFHPSPGDRYVAGGAIDEQLFTDVRLGLLL
jgi:hypothetical protein